MSYFPEPSLRAPEKQKRKTKWTPNGLIHSHSLIFARHCRLGLKEYTGKDEYKFGDLTKATVRKVTGSNGYNFGDLTKGGHEARHRQG